MTFGVSDIPYHKLSQNKGGTVSSNNVNLKERLPGRLESKYP